MLRGLVSRNDALRWQQDATLADQTLGDLISDASVPFAHADDTVGYVVDLMLLSEVGRIPIVDATTGKLTGVIARKDLLQLRHSQRTMETDRQPYFQRKAAV